MHFIMWKKTENDTSLYMFNDSESLILSTDWYYWLMVLYISDAKEQMWWFSELSYHNYETKNVQPC